MPTTKSRRRAPADVSTLPVARAAAAHLATALGEPVCLVRPEVAGGPVALRRSECAGVDRRRVIETVQPGVAWIQEAS